METLRDTLEGIVMDGDTIQFILSHDRDIEVARRIFPTVLHYSNHPKSIYDFGCGIGTWTKALIELGFKDTVLGLDVPNIQKNGLTIPDKNFKPLGEVKSLEKRDLCISTRIDTIASDAEKYLYIKSLIALSPVILFLSKTNYSKAFTEVGFVKVSGLFDRFDLSEDYKFLFYVKESKISHYDKLNYWYEKNKKAQIKKISKEFGVRL